MYSTKSRWLQNLSSIWNWFSDFKSSISQKKSIPNSTSNVRRSKIHSNLFRRLQIQDFSKDVNFETFLPKIWYQWQLIDMSFPLESTCPSLPVIINWSSCRLGSHCYHVSSDFFADLIRSLRSHTLRHERTDVIIGKSDVSFEDRQHDT